MIDEHEVWIECPFCGGQGLENIYVPNREYTTTDTAPCVDCGGAGGWWMKIGKEYTSDQREKEINE